MGNLSRIGVSIDSELLRRFDRFIAERGYENRSGGVSRIDPGATGGLGGGSKAFVVEPSP
jgi:hypothetical protein